MITNALRRLTSVLFVCGCALVPPGHGNAAADEGSESDSLPPSSRQIRLADRLIVNESAPERIIVRGRCEVEGIGDIRELMMRSRFEELWVFVPPGNSDNCYWIEIGEETRSESGMATVKVDWEYLERLMARFNELHLYHFHPLVYFERCTRRPGCNSFLVPTAAGIVSMEALAINLQFAMPSAEDIYFMSESSWRHGRYHPAGAATRHRVVSPYGVIEYSLSEAGKKRYELNRGSRMEGLYIKLVAANALTDQHILKVIGNHPQDMTGALEELAGSMNSDNLHVRLITAE